MRALIGLLIVLVVVGGLAGASVWVASHGEAEAAARVRSDVDAVAITYTIEATTLARTVTASARVRPRVTIGLPARGIVTPVVTSVDVAVGDTIVPGRSVLEVQGRPVTVLKGGFPPWRDYAVGMSRGKDVAQLQSALAALGVYEGPTDGTFGPAVQRAVARMYEMAGYRTPDEAGDAQASLPASEVWFVPAGTWTVDDVDVEVGDMLMPDLVVIGSADVVVSFTLPESVVPEVGAGDGITLFRADASFETTIGGIVSVVSGDDATDVVTVTVSKDVPDDFDSATRALITLATTESPVMVVPSSAISYDGDTTYVYVRGQATERKVPVRLGMESEGFFEIVDGDVEVGDQVVLGHGP